LNMAIHRHKSSLPLRSSLYKCRMVLSWTRERNEEGMGRRCDQHSGVSHWLPIGFPGRTKTTSVQALSLSCLFARPFAIKRGYATPGKRTNASRNPRYCRHATALQTNRPAEMKVAGGKREERHGRYRITRPTSRGPSIRLAPVQALDLQQTGQAPHPRRSR